MIKNRIKKMKNQNPANEHKSCNGVYYDSQNEACCGTKDNAQVYRIGVEECCDGDPNTPYIVLGDIRC